MFGEHSFSPCITYVANVSQKTTYMVWHLVLKEHDWWTKNLEDIFVDNVHIELSLWDTAGQEEFDRLRSLSYDNTHTIMLCFTVRAIIPHCYRSQSDKWNRSTKTTP